MSRATYEKERKAFNNYTSAQRSDLFKSKTFPRHEMRDRYQRKLDGEFHYLNAQKVRVEPQKLQSFKRKYAKLKQKVILQPRLFPNENYHARVYEN